MLFLLNDVVVELGSAMDAPPAVVAHLATLKPGQVIRLVAEAFARDPNFPRNSPAAARKAAVMLMLKAPELNAAMFVAPRPGCDPAHVHSRFANVDAQVLYELKGHQDAGRLNSGLVNAYVWSLARHAA